MVSPEALDRVLASVSSTRARRALCRGTAPIRVVEAAAGPCREEEGEHEASAELRENPEGEVIASSSVSSMPTLRSIMYVKDLVCYQPDSDV